MQLARPSTVAPLLALALVVGGCASAPPRTGTAPTMSTMPTAPTTAPGSESPQTAPPHRTSNAVGSASAPRVRRVLAKNIDTPWGIAFLPGGAALVGSRDTARVYRVAPGGGKSRVGVVRGVVSNGSRGGEGGLLGLAVSPAFAQDRRVYAYFSTGTDNRIGWLAYRGGKLKKKVHVILRGIPHGLHHNGGGLVFGPDGALYASTGDSGNGALAQSRSSLGGKVLRMTRSGKVPGRGNPFRGSLVYSYGHRNVEGLAFDAAGRLWATEFGDKAYDELNLIRPGRNYGWPAVEGRSAIKRYQNPRATWRTHNAGPAGIAVVSGHAWIGGLTGHRLWRLRLTGGQASGKKAFLRGDYGRLRSVVAAPDGRTLWLATSNTDGRATPRRGDDRILAVRLG